MPKKTRQEKILAQLRRLREQSETNVESEIKTNSPSEIKETPSYELKSLGPVTKNIAPTVKKDSENYSYVVSDLRKTLFFAVGAVLFEIILSLTASTGYAKLFFKLF